MQTLAGWSISCNFPFHCMKQAWYWGITLQCLQTHTECMPICSWVYQCKSGAGIPTSRAYICTHIGLDLGLSAKGANRIYFHLACSYKFHEPNCTHTTPSHQYRPRTKFMIFISPSSHLVLALVSINIIDWAKANSSISQLWVWRSSLAWIRDMNGV